MLLQKAKKINEEPKMTKTIFVVDDEEDIRESVKTLLEKNGYNVITAENGDDCLNKLKKVTPDLILLDIMMPGMPISDVVKNITDIKIAFMSVVRISDARKKGLTSQDNIVDFLQKPFNVTDLIDRVELHLSN
jgi:DNA-binding response OmpR family regulator